MKRMITMMTGLVAAAAAAMGAGPTGGAAADEPVFAAVGEGAVAGVTVSVAPLYEAVPAGGEQVVAVVLDHAPKYHTWPAEEMGLIPDGLFVQFTDITLHREGDKVDNPEEMAPEREVPWAAVVGDVIWPETHEAMVPGAMDGSAIMLHTFSGKAIAYVPVVVSDTAEPGPVELPLRVYTQACDDQNCMMPTDDFFVISFDVVPAGSPAVSSGADQSLFAGFDQSVFAEVRANAGKLDAVKFSVFGLKFEIDPNGPIGFGLLLAVAALGGFLLNLTPCVLPVIPLKIMGLSAAAGHPGRCFWLGVVMSAGIVAFFMLIGVAIISFTGFTAISSLFQQPWFSLVVGAVILVFALGMFGAFTVSLPKAVYRFNPSHETVHGSFMFGVLTAVLSTPCTAPLMGAAAAFAVTQTTAVVLSVFGAIGAGMALPYLVLSANPEWVSKMPRTGPASELVKQVMGLLLLAVAAFFGGIGIAAVTTTPPDPPTRVYWWFVAALAVAAGVWLAYRTFRLTKAAGKRVVFAVVGLVLAVGGVGAAVVATDEGPIDWVYYTDARLAEAEARGDVIVVDFTADWCLNCKAIEKAVLYRPQVVELLNGPGVTPMKVDFTTRNPEGKALMKSLNRVAIPLLAVWGPEVGEPFLEDHYTVGEVVGWVAESRGGSFSPTVSGPAGGGAGAGGADVVPVSGGAGGAGGRGRRERPAGPSEPRRGGLTAAARGAYFSAPRRSPMKRSGDTQAGVAQW